MVSYSKYIISTLLTAAMSSCAYAVLKKSEEHRSNSCAFMDYSIHANQNPRKKELSFQTRTIGRGTPGLFFYDTDFDKPGFEIRDSSVLYKGSILNVLVNQHRAEQLYELVLNNQCVKANDFSHAWIAEDKKRLEDSLKKDVLEGYSRQLPSIGSLQK